MTFRRVEEVSGPRSYHLALVGRGLFVLWLLACAALLIAVLARPSDPPASYFGTYVLVFCCWIGSAVATVILIVLVQLQMQRERRHGFTWAKDNYRNLDEIDPVSYVVIRAAGEPFLTSSQRHLLVEQARLWAAERATK